MKRALLLVCALLGACNHAPPPKTQALAVSPPLAASADKAQAFELPVLGLRLRAPCAPESFETDQTLSDGPMHTIGAGCKTDTQQYFVARYFREGRDRSEDAVVLQGARKALQMTSHEVPITVGEWSGVQLEGTTLKNHPALLRAFVVGDGFWLAQAESSTGPLDHQAAQAFLDSISVSQVWSVYAFPEGHFSALLPDGGVRLHKQQLGAKNFTVAEGIWLGGSQTRSFIVWSIALKGEGTPDERMDAMQASLSSDGYRLLWQAPIEVDGARGRDFLAQSKDVWTRLRIVVTATNLYMMQANALSKDALLDESAPRFLASLRWFEQ